MLYARFQNSSQSIVWHLGNELHQATIKDNANDVIMVQADCDELDYILNKFKNLPCTTDRVQKWYGDFAKFIAGNL